MSKTKIIDTGSPIGLCDSNGIEFKVGSVVRLETDNKKMHGDWVDYEISLQGTTPLLIYLYSEKGDILPKGYTGCCLSDYYDHKMFLFAKDSLSLRPDEQLLIQQ